MRNRKHLQSRETPKYSSCSMDSLSEARDEGKPTLEECMAGAEICWPLQFKDCCPKILDQLESETCHAYAVITVIAYVSALTGDKKMLECSVQELKDRLAQLVLERDEAIPFDTKKGFATSPENGLWYASTWGLYSESEYPLLEKGISREWKKAPSYPPGKKTRIDKYEYFDEIGEAQYASIDEQLRKHPLLGVITCDEELFRAWDGMDVYEESEAELAAKAKDREEADKPVHHAMVIVGSGVGYYIFQNSWGPDWGYHGFCKIASKYLKQVGWPVGIKQVRVACDGWKALKAEKKAEMRKNARKKARRR